MRSNSTVHRVLAAASLAAAMLAPPTAAAEPCKLQALEIPVHMRGSRAIATVGLNGTEVPLMVDSGAFFSMLSPAAAQQLKLKVGPLPWGMSVQGLAGEIEAGVAEVKEMQLVGGKLPNMDFLVGGNEDPGATMGVLGRNILAITDIEYDLAHGVIRLMFPKGDCGSKGMAYWAGDKPYAELPLLREERRTRTPAITAVVELNGRKMRVLFDTGASSIVSLSAAKRLGLTEATMKPNGKSYGAGRGSADSWIAEFASIDLGGEVIKNFRARVVDFKNLDEDMLLGIDFFLSHRIYISKSQRKMYFTYNGGPVFALSDTAPPSAGPAASAPELASADAYARRGAAAATRGDLASARADLDRALQLSPQTPAYFVQRAHVLERLKQPQEALADYEAALQLDAALPDALLGRAWHRLAGKQRDAALQDADALDRSLAPQANQRRELAGLYDALGVDRQLIRQLDLWAAVRPDDIALPSALNQSCWKRTMLNVELDRALKDCERAVDVEPKNASYIDSRAWVRLRRGEFSKAVADFDRALAIKGDIAESLYGRGIARTRQGQAAAGKADIEAARKIDAKIDETMGRHGLGADS